MPLVRIVQNKQSVTVSAQVGVSLLEILQKNDCNISGECGGMGTCGKCRVLVHGCNSEISPTEREYLSADQLKAGWRLACYTRITDDCWIELPLAFADYQGGDLKVSPEYLAVDLGSTTVVLGLVDGEGRLINRISGDNPQRLYGSDVLTRLSYALQSNENRDLLRRLAVNMINNLLNKIDTSRVKGISIVGNPAMIHLLLGLNIQGLSAYPYKGEIKGPLVLTAEQMGLALTGHIPVYLPPAAGLYVGSDALAGAISLLPQSNFILVDLGTNAEVVAAGSDQWMAVSAAAGPAFEGASIYQGMRAIPGAISDADYINGQLKLQVIAGAAPIGICGSGLIKVIALLRKLQVIDDNGIISAQPPVPIPIRTGSQGPEVILYQEMNYTVVLTQEDVRQFQLAKSAVRVAIDALINRLPGVEWQNIYLAGALGSSLSLNALIELGVIPDIPQAALIAVGNAALQGAVRAVYDWEFRQQLEAAASRVQVIELADEPGFQSEFLKHLSLTLLPAKGYFPQ